MLSIEVPETDAKNAKQAKKEVAKANAKQSEVDEEMEGVSEMMEDMGKMGKMDPECMLQCKADIIAKAQEYLADPELMTKLQPLLDKKVKALKGIAGLKQKLSAAQMREMKKGG